MFILFTPTCTASHQTVLQLMYLLDESSDAENIISWSADGSSFIIHDPVQFEREVLPKNFKDAKYKSFCRKVSFLHHVSVLV
jgi:hypothetical protein